jgi:hypothetical protein
MIKEIGRNDPCWCGSGKKYKQCHINKGQEKEIPSYEISKDFISSIKFKTCKVPNTIKEECSKRIIKAHTISKSANLKYIQRDGKVYTMFINYLAIKDNPKIELKLQGINTASTFYIFCQRHDKELFSPLEDKVFVFSKKQIFLLAFRIIAKSIYLKEQQIKLFSEQVPLYDRGLNTNQQRYIQEISSLFSNFDLQLKNIQNIKDIYDTNLINKDFNSIKYYCIVIDKIPEIMNSGSFFPDIDFYGNINEKALDNNAIFTSIINVDNKGIIIFSWNEELESRECNQFINSLHIIPNVNKIKAVTCLFFKKVKENLCISPSWYDDLTQSKKDLIEISYNSPFDDYINNFAEFDFFDWNILEIKTNITDLIE